jgi:dihydrofolate reductase
MTRIRYSVAVSLDGYIAGPNGEYDWIIPDPEVNFSELWAEFDTLLMGRPTYEVAVGALASNLLPE